MDGWRGGGSNEAGKRERKKEFDDEILKACFEKEGIKHRR